MVEPAISHLPRVSFSQLTVINVFTVRRARADSRAAKIEVSENRPHMSHFFETLHCLAHRKKLPLGSCNFSVPPSAVGRSVVGRVSYDWSAFSDSPPYRIDMAKTCLHVPEATGSLSRETILSARSVEVLLNIAPSLRRQKQQCSARQE